MKGKNEAAIPEIEQLQEFKKRSGWSYEKIASFMGVHAQTIVFWLTGKTNPSPMAKEKINKFLNEFYIK